MPIRSSPVVSVIALTVLTTVAPVLASACSVASSCAKGRNVNGDFAVTVKHKGKALAGVNVSVISSGAASGSFQGVTGADGRVRVSGLPPGSYLVEAHLLGIATDSECIQVVKASGIRAISLSWGSSLNKTTKVVGHLMDFKVPEGSTQLEQILGRNRQEKPPKDATITLHDVFSRTKFTTSPDSQGAFAFDVTQVGTYVLQVEGGSAGNGRDYFSTTLLVEIDSRAKRDFLELVRSNTGICGGHILYLKPPIRATR